MFQNTIAIAISKLAMSKLTIPAVMYVSIHDMKYQIAR